MENQASELLEKIRQQYDTCPYPKISLEQSPKDNHNQLFIHNLVTSYYLRYQKVINTKGKLILDAGCGSGYTTLTLAEANPGAKIVAIDISEESIRIARQRLESHGFDNIEFRVMSIYDLPSLGMEFDYINNDELLYMLPDQVAALKAMKSVLKPEGIIRTNLHSSLQRFRYFRVQELFRMMGLLDGNPEDFEIDIALDTMKALKNITDLKANIWNNSYEGEAGKQRVLMNYLFQGDKGYTIPEMFTFLREAELDFISMVNWRHWDITDLFQEPDNLPAAWGMSLPDISVEERLHMFELIHPVHRLLDFWCCQTLDRALSVPIEDWADSDWERATVHLHPQIATNSIREALLKSVAEHQYLEISQDVKLPASAPVEIDSTAASCLLPLWDGPQSVKSLVQRWQKIRPFNVVTLEPISEKDAFTEIKKLLSKLEVFLYVLLDRG
jgi:ubiquinone/menaquinone biosynthesis C-methylase UbiE